MPELAEADVLRRLVTPETTPGWKRQLLDNADLFLLKYFPHKIGKLEEFHLELIRIAMHERRGLVLFPAGHGKSTIVSTCLPILAICRDPNVRIGIIAKNMTESSAIVRSLQSELKSNEELIQDFGPFHAGDAHQGPWSLFRFDVAKRTSRDKSSTVAMFGAGSKDTLGYRTDWTICDDVVTQDNSSTPEQRFKLRQWFNQQVGTMPQESDDRITVVGTVFDPSDLYHDLEEVLNPMTGERVWTGARYDAIKDEEKQEPLWPAQWDWERLMIEKATYGTIDFNKRLRNIAVDPSRMVFREEYIKGGWARKREYPGCLERGYAIGDELDPSWRRVAGFDPAVGLGRKAKFCAHIILAYGMCDRHEHCYWVLDLIRDQLTLPQQVDRCLTQHQEYNLDLSVIESNSYQAGLYQALEQKIKDGGFEMRVEPHYTSRMNKPDPELGVQAMAPAFENGWVHIPWRNMESQRKMEILVDELIQFPGRTTDTVMAFWFAWRKLKEAAPRYKSFNRLESIQGSGTSPWRRHMGRWVVKNPYYDREVV